MKNVSREYKISQNIKKYRLLNNLTQEKLSEMLNLDTQYYAQCERGERNFSLDRICAAATLFDVGIENLIELPKPEKEKNEEMVSRLTAYLDKLSNNQLIAVEKVITDIVPLIK